MTLYVASLFLPYTIDFEAATIRHRRKPSDGSNTPRLIDKVEGRLAELHHETRPKVLDMTPGATTEYEKIFKPFYASQSAADESQGPVPTEFPVESWGSSRKFNQPLSKATNPPDASILNRPNANNGGTSRLEYDPDSEEVAIPRVILSDVDWVVKSAVQGNGGLRNAINAAVREGIVQDRVMVGTLGMPTDSLKDHTREKITRILEERYDSLAVLVGDNEFEGHYFHFCRNVLYPAFHYQMQESPRHKEYDDHSWSQYVKLNERFADAIATKWKPGDRIWINDYHLMLLPSLLRQRLPKAEIGFFMHTAFPSSEVFRCLTHREALLKGLLGANLIGFQTAEYVYHFHHTCNRILRLEVSADGILLPDRLLPTKAFPIGIDNILLESQRKSSDVMDWVLKIRNRYEGKHLIVARDRLDAAGGIKQKLLAYEKFLKRYPEWRENVVLIQVASSATDMTDLESEVSKITMRINSNYSTLTHQPLVLLKQDISFAQFLALMSVAEVFMITSLREGMNLSGHDFISCQDGNSGIPQRYGSLILSEFTGSASIWSGHGLLVNPWDYAQCAAAINQALTMSPQEKETNWRFLTDRMTRNTASMWCKSYLTSLHQAYDGHISRELASDSSFSIDDLKEEYQISNNRMFVLEESSIFPTLKIPGSDRMSLDLKNSRVSILKSLSSDPQNAVYMTSPRTPKQLELILKELPEIGLIAENGVFLRHPGSQKTEWQQLLSEEDTRDWRWGVQRVMQYFQERTEGTYIEEDRFSLTFSYKDSLDPELAIRQSSELTHQINGSRGNVPIRAVMIADEGTVTVGPTTVTQTTTAELALQYITKEKNAAPDFLVVIGSSPRAGEMFRWANKLSQEGRVGNVINFAVGEKASTAAATVLDANGSLIDGLANLV